jgi:hypothetical protein
LLSKHSFLMFSILIRQHFTNNSTPQFYFFTIFFAWLILRSSFLRFLSLLQFSCALKQLFPKLYFCILAFFSNSILFFPFRTWIQNHFQAIHDVFLQTFVKSSFSVHCYHPLRIHIAIFISNSFFLRNSTMLTRVSEESWYYYLS